MTRTRLYRDGELVDENFPPEQISDRLADGATVAWLDLCEPTEADFRLLRQELGLHQLAVEDALTPGQRSKVDHYDTHLFINVHAASMRADDGMALCELAMFVTKRVLVTVRHEDGIDMDAVVERWDISADLAGNGVAYLLHGLLDVLADSHLGTAEELDEAVEDIEGMLFDDGRHPPRAVQRRLLRLRRDLVELRRVVLPMRDVVTTLMRPTTGVVEGPMVPYYQDVYDHVLRVVEWTDSLRDLATTVMDTSLMVQGNRMNNIMKQVTSWAAIIAVPTAVTGFYGQNVPYPGFGQTWGFLVSSVMTVLLALILLVTFRRRDWL